MKQSCHLITPLTDGKALARTKAGEQIEINCVASVAADAGTQCCVELLGNKWHIYAMDCK